MIFDYHGLPVHYEQFGSGNDVLMLHGWGGCIASFAPITEHLCKKYRVTVIDFPGFGETPSPNEAWSVSDYADMTEEFMERVFQTPCDIISHSFGGRVSIVMAARNHGNIRRMVFCDAAGVRNKLSMKTRIKVFAYKFGKRLSKSKTVCRILNWFGYDLKSRIAKSGSADYRALSGVMRQTFVKVVNEDLTPLLRRITVPVLLIWGSEDKDTPLWHAKVMEKQIPDAGLVIYEGAGHFAYLERAAAVNRVLDTFLGEE